MKPFLRSTSSSRHFKPTPARVVRLGIACAALLAGAGFVRAASCDTQCEPAAGSSEGFVSPTPGSETTWSGSVPSPTPTPTPGITGARAINFTDTGDNVVPDNQTVGWAFTVNSNQNENRPVTVTALGVWDGPSISPSPSPTPTPTATPGDGLENEHQVTIWDSNGTPLVSGTVPAATAAPADDDDFRYVAVDPPVTLPNGQYVIGAYYPTGNKDPYSQNASSVAADPRITYTGGLSGCSAGDGEPTCNSQANRFFGPNFLIASEQAKDQFLVDVRGTHHDYHGLQVDVTVTSEEVGVGDFDVYVYEAVPQPTPTPTPTPTNTVAPTKNVVASNGIDYKEGPLVAYAAHRNTNPETATFIPSELSTGIYIVDVYYFSGSNESEPYTGSAKVNVQAGPAGLNTATYTTAANGGTIKFGPNITIKAPLAPADGNPQDRTDILGNHYTGGMRGNPTGDDLWYIDLRPTIDDPGNPGNSIPNPNYDPNTRVPLYRYNFIDNSFIPAFDGYLALAVGLVVPQSPKLTNVSSVDLGNPVLAFSGMFRSDANSIFPGTSYDRGQSENFNMGMNLGTDQNGRKDLAPQQWEEFLGGDAVYMLYRTKPNDLVYGDNFNYNGPTGEAFVNRSQGSPPDPGFNFSSAARNTGLAIGELGPVDVDQTDGTVYGAGRTGNVLVGVPTPTPSGAQPAFRQATRALFSGDTPPEPDAYNLYKAATDPNGVGHALFATKVADDGVVYGVYSNGADIFLVSSVDQGKSWSNPVQVNNDTTQTNIFPWLETGPTGKVGVIWYATANTPANNPTPTATPEPDSAIMRSAPEAERQGNNANADWKVYFAQIGGANSDTPAIEIAEVTEPKHYVHSGSIWDGGCDPTEAGCVQRSDGLIPLLPILLGEGPTGPNHNLFDYIQLSFDPEGAAVVSYTDDHNDYRGNIYVARQISGPGINGTALPALVQGKAPEGEALAAPTPCPDFKFFFGRYPQEPCYEFPPPQPDIGPGSTQTNAQVTDFAFDYQGFCGGNVERPTSQPPSFECLDNSWDIRTVRYGSTGAAGNLSIFAAMKVTDLTFFNPFGDCPPLEICEGSGGIQVWRMSFSINPPHGGISDTDPTTGQYSFALSDRGDQFYLEARVNPFFFIGLIGPIPIGPFVGAQPFDFNWGVAIRNPDGSQTFSLLGPADYGFVSFDTNTIYVQIGIDKINGWLTPIGHPPVGNKSLVAGLRGRTFMAEGIVIGPIGAAASTASRNFLQDADGNPDGFTSSEDVIDETRGGTEFMIKDSSAAGTTVQFASDQYSVNEDAGHATLTVTRTGDTSGGSVVHWATSDGTATAGQDYTASSGDVSFAPGETTQTIQVPILDDTTAEGSEDFTVTLSNPVAASLGAPSIATVTINDNDAAASPTPSPTPAIVAFDEAQYDVNEDDGSALVSVSRSGNTATTVTVDFATSDDTAKAPGDYTATSGTLTFGPGVTSQVIKIPVIDDTQVESTEDFHVAITNPSANAQVGSPSQTIVIIHDDDAAPTPTPSASPTATPTATATATPSPSPSKVELVNLSARALVQTGDAVAVGGFIIRGDEQTTKRIVVRGIGPSLPVADALQDPVIELHEANGATIEINDNWEQGPSSAQVASSGLAPHDSRESAIYRVLTPGSYTVVMHGVNQTTGVGLVEIYDLDSTSTNFMADLSSRAFVSTGDNVLIDGLILQGDSPQSILVRAIGPDLETERDVSGAMQDPTLELHDANGVQIAFNDDWRSDQQDDITATGLAPHDDRDSALLRTLSAGKYTAIVRGKGGTTGVALGEVYNLGNP